MMRITLLITALLLYAAGLFSQERVYFYAPDSLKISAFLYAYNDDPDNNKPYILLFHQANYSKGEYKETAPKLVKLGFNCLAVDLRSGGEVNYESNETASRAQAQGLPTRYVNAEQDVRAAIEYAFEKSGQPVILFGSSYSASLCLKISKKNDSVKAVVAFSPGEYFKSDNITIQNELEALKKHVFVAGSQREQPYLIEILEKTLTEEKVVFTPSGGPGEHGSKALWKSCSTSDEYWLALLTFLRKYSEVIEE